VLNYLSLKYVGPGAELTIEPSSRLNMLTGDNGLGKTFMLDVAWWALTNTWAEHAALPGDDAEYAAIQFRCSGNTLLSDVIQGGIQECTYDWQSSNWNEQPPVSGVEHLTLFVRADGGMALRDPYRNADWVPKGKLNLSKAPLSFRFSQNEVWEGLSHGKHTYCNGLLSDWIQWQYRDQQTFKMFSTVLDRLSPQQEEKPVAADPIRLAVGDTREIPSLRFSYGTTPVTHLSSGMKRALTLAYMLVWSFKEHQIAAKMRKKEPLRHMVLLIDELEAHLHPLWQRTMLPAIMDVINLLDHRMDTQLLISSHSPLTLASIEPFFDTTKDKIFSFKQKHQIVSVAEAPWARQGDVTDWLTSEIFGLAQARSVDAERAIAAANAFSRGDVNALPEQLRTREAIDRELSRVLAGDDPF